MEDFSSSYEESDSTPYEESSEDSDANSDFEMEESTIVFENVEAAPDNFWDEGEEENMEQVGFDTQKWLRVFIPFQGRKNTPHPA